MSKVIPPSSRMLAPELSGQETWLDPDGVCRTTFKEIEARWGISEPRAFAIVLLRALPYEEYLRTPHWQTVRLDIWRLQDGKCGACTNGVIRDVHHRPGGYDRKGFERNEDVIGLCRPCHEIEHNSLVVRLREEMRNLRQ